MRNSEHMHKFLRSIGFSTYKRKRDIEKLLASLIPSAKWRRIQLDEETNLCELRAEVAPGMGIVMMGEMDEEGAFQCEYYYPYLNSPDASSTTDCSIQRHTEKETYAGLLDEYRVGISLIFYLENCFEYRERKAMRMPRTAESVNLTGLAIEGKVLLPLHKTRKQIEMARVAARDRNNLLEAAKKGDEDAMETLTIEDIDLYSQVSRRAMKEDLYSIVDSSFMPFGVECDQYSVLGEIQEVEKVTNGWTNEEIYVLMVECSDLVFQIGINADDLLGEPAVGRRFKGNVWLQGYVNFAD